MSKSDKLEITFKSGDSAVHQFRWAYCHRSLAITSFCPICGHRAFEHTNQHSGINVALAVGCYMDQPMCGCDFYRPELSSREPGGADV